MTGGVVVPLERAIADLEQRIGYRFRDVGLLEHALTHKSKAHEDATGGVVDNESLEFLGDAVLGFVVADLLYREFPHFQEGQKSKAKAALVSTAALAELAERIGLGAYLLLGRGEEKTGGRQQAGAAGRRLRGGHRGGLSRWRHRGRARLHPQRAGATRSSTCGRPTSCATSSRRCRSVCRRIGRPLPDYEVTAERGPDHDKRFHVTVRVGGDVLAERGRPDEEGSGAGGGEAALENADAR